MRGSGALEFGSRDARGRPVFFFFFFKPSPQDELAAFIARVNPGAQLTAVQMETVIEEVREREAK